ncbi:MAG: ATP-dependent Clp protease proteolytic subunit [Fusobacteriaceae bacterium]
MISKIKRRLNRDDLDSAGVIAQPTVYNGLEGATYTLFFNDLLFTNETVESIITTLEDVKVSESYSIVEIYLSSCGGLANQLMLLADYLQNYELGIIFKIHGEIASCGALLPLMVNEAEIIFLPTARAMFHLGYQNINSSTKYKYKPNLDGASADLESLSNMNKYVWDNYYSKLDLEAEEMKALEEGGDVFINRERIEDIYDSFKIKKFYEEEYEEYVESIDLKLEEAKKAVESLESRRKTATSTRDRYLKNEIEEITEEE